MLFPPFLPFTLGAGYWYLNVPARSRPQGEASKARVDAGPMRIRRENFMLVDRSRPTAAYGRFSGHDDRRFRGAIWRPARANGPMPLVVYCHGFMSSRGEGQYLANFLASHGHVVAAIDFPLTCTRSPGGRPLAADFVNQPADVGFLIDHVLARNDDPDDPLCGALDPQRIAIVGLSMGALVSMLATFHREKRDPRIAAAVFIAGPTNLFTERFFSGSKVPSLMIYGDRDSLVLHEEHAVPALHRIDNGILVTLKDASHAGFAQQASTYMRFLKNPDSIACRIVRAGLGDAMMSDISYRTLLGGAKHGITEPDKLVIAERPLVPVSMAAARQQMFTNLAVHAFLESRFAERAAQRACAEDYLLRALPAENPAEVSVLRSSRRARSARAS